MLVLNEKTKAFVEPGAKITADNSLVAGAPGVEVSASDTTNIVSVAGNLAVSGTTGVGVGVGVTTLNKETYAFIDSAVTADVEGDIRVLADSVEDFTGVAAGVSVSTNAVAVDAAVTIYNIKTRAFIGDDHLDDHHPLQAQAMCTPRATSLSMLTITVNSTR